MKIDEYIWLLSEAIREDGDVSLFYILDEMIEFLSKCKSKRKIELLNCLQRSRDIINKMEILVYGNVKPGRLYHLRTLRGFYDECQSNNNRMKQHTLETLYKRVCDEMDDFEMKYSTEFEVNANGNVIADWLETVPDEAFKVQSRPRF